ncbi:hypothetical protein ABLN64_02820, partial [Mycobacterium tuberculosis]
NPLVLRSRIMEEWVFNQNDFHISVSFRIYRQETLSRFSCATLTGTTTLILRLIVCSASWPRMRVS